MIVRVGMAPRLPGMSVADFQRHWRSSHADVAGRIPGVRRYIQNHAVLGEERLLPYPGFDACAELDFDSVAAMDAGFASKVYQRAVIADEQAFVDKSRFSLLVGERRVVTDGADLAGVKLMTFWRRHPSSSDTDLVAELGGRYAEAARAAGGQRHELIVPLPGAHRDSPPAAEVLDLVWFAGAEVAADFALGDGAYVLAGLAFGAARHLARPFRVV